MARAIDTIKGLKSTNLVDLVIALRQDSPRLRGQYIKFARENKEFAKELRRELNDLIEDRADAQLRREFGFGSADAPVQLSGDFRKQFPKRKREILEELVSDIKVKGKVQRKIDAGDYGPFITQSRELESLDFAARGASPDERRIEQSERASRTSQKLENLIAGEPGKPAKGAVGKQLEFGGTSIVAGPEGRTAIQRSITPGEGKADIYDLDVRGNIIPDTRQRISDLTRRKATRGKGGKRELSKDRASVERDRLLQEARSDVGGMKRMLSKEEIDDLPKGVRSSLPANRRDIEVYKMKNGGYRVIVPGSSPVKNLARTPRVFEYSKMSESQKQNLVDQDVDLEYRKRALPNFQDMEYEDVEASLEKMNAQEVTDPEARKFISRNVREGRMKSPNTDSYRIFKVPGTPEGQFLVFADVAEELRIPGPPRKGRSVQTIMTPDDYRKTLGTPSKVTTSGTGTLTSQEAAQRLRAREGRVLSGDIEGTATPSLTYRGLTPGEAEIEARRIAKLQAARDSKVALEIEDLTQYEADEILNRKADEILAKKGPTKILQDQIRSLKKTNIKSQGTANRIAELEQTIENLKTMGLEVDEVRRTLGVKPSPLSDLDKTLDEVQDIAELRGGMPSTRSSAVSGFSPRSRPRMRGPLGNVLRLADLLRQAL